MAGIPLDYREGDHRPEPDDRPSLADVYEPRSRRRADECPDTGCTCAWCPSLAVSPLDLLTTPDPF